MLVLLYCLLPIYGTSTECHIGVCPLNMLKDGVTLLTSTDKHTVSLQHIQHSSQSSNYKINNIPRLQNNEINVDAK